MKLEHVNEERFAKNLSRAIQIATISHEDEADTDWTKFKEFHDFLKEAYPKTFSTLDVEEVGLSYTGRAAMTRWIPSDF